MAKKAMKVTVRNETVDRFKTRVLRRARKLDRGESIEPGIAISFEDPTDMLRFLSRTKLTLLKAIRENPGPMSTIVKEVDRDRSAVARDVQLLEAYGLVKTRMESNPGHGRHKIVIPKAEKFSLVTEI